jgi:hypothetical protein
MLDLGSRKVMGKGSVLTGKVKIWSRMVSLWKLPYWHKLKVRHNLDVMHIETNICESLMATFSIYLERQRAQLKLGLI